MYIVQCNFAPTKSEGMPFHPFLSPPTHFLPLLTLFPLLFSSLPPPAVKQLPKASYKFGGMLGASRVGFREQHKPI